MAISSSVPDFNALFRSAASDADLTALSTRVDGINTRLSKLEGGYIQPPTTTESTHGTTLTSASGVITDSAGRKWTLVASTSGLRGPYQIALNGAVQSITQGVTNLRYYKPTSAPVMGLVAGCVVQLNDQNTYYASSISTTGEVSWQSLAGDPFNPPKNYYVSNGHIYTPDGTRFKGRGLNNGTHGVNNKNDSVDTLRVMKDNLLRTFPGCNLLRQQIWQVGLDGGITPDDFAPMIDTLTSAGVVVLLEYHDYQFTLQGGQLQQVAQFYTNCARRFASNPRVWFAAQNEPASQQSGEIDNMNRTLYAAARSGGNQQPFGLCINGGWSLNTLNKGAYTDLSNVWWDTHFYAWRVNGTSGACSVAEAASKVNAAIAELRGWTTKDGVPPIMFGECGSCGIGPQLDPGGPQSYAAALQAVERGDADGAMAWSWRSYNTLQPGMQHIPADLVIPPWTGGAGSLTKYPAAGDATAAWMRDGSITIT